VNTNTNTNANTNTNTNANTNTNNTTYSGSNTNTNTNTNTSTSNNTNNNISSGGTNNTNANTNVNTSTNTNTNTNNSTVNSTANNNNTNINTSTVDQNVNSNSTSNNTNTNTNTNKSESTSDSNVTTNNKNENTNKNENINKNETNQTIKQEITTKAPPASAIAPSIGSSYSQDLCTTGISGAFQGQLFGLSAGKSVRDMNCERIKLSKTLYDMGMKVAAVSLMCQDERVFTSMMMAGTPCPYEGKIGEAARLAWEENADQRPDKKSFLKKGKLTWAEKRAAKRAKKLKEKG
jgi:DNA polymerase III alpha subunit (gram-positive type)